MRVGLFKLFVLTWRCTPPTSRKRMSNFQLYDPVAGGWNQAERENIPLNTTQ